MSLVTRIVHGVRALFNRDATNRDLDEEVRHFLDASVADHIAKGMSPRDAERAARAALGSVAAVQEPARSHGWDVTVETVLQDVRYAARYLAKSPGFTLAATASLALGIGANTAIFSMVNATLIKRLPVERSQELVTVSAPTGAGVFSYPALDGMRRESGSVLSGLLGFGGIGVSMTEGEGIDLVSGVIVTGNYFQLLGVRPLRGRLLQPSDDVTPGAHPVAVISAAFWKRRFAEREEIVGLNVRLNGQPFTIVGVTPPGFIGTQSGSVRDIWVPMMMQAWMRPPRAGYSGEMNPDLLRVRTNTWIFAIGRLKPGTSTRQAEDALTSVARAMGDWTSPRDSMPRITVARLDDGPPGQRDQLRSVATLLTAVVMTVLSLPVPT